jgi:opacity protein-like surface antigen
MIRFVRSAVIISAVALAVNASSADAQVNFAIGGGPTIGIGDLGDATDMGYHGQLSVGFGVPVLPVGLRADGMFTRLPFAGEGDGNFQVLSGTLNAVLNIPSVGITPYVIGGVGFYNTKFDMDEVDSESETDVGVNVGAGVRFGLPGLGVFVEGRLHNIFGDGDSVRMVPITLGIRL